ncbi:acyltransferase [Devosia oryziradicis]|uniref:Acyltransferase n=1 Tax=Devosia oryziradicis TaxID=2801335 RepID=A0ABX7BUI7_9HYPH|nr:acyltransferase [Devosia oryziradicis]QQR35218.1 acyltransferase [Devosia oryziradicis]
MSRITEPQSVFLDALRGLSALAVLIGHAFSMLPWHPALGVKYPIQSYAVAVFFILSGFLIGRNTMSRSATYSLSEYLIDRFARIFLAFVPALIFVAVADHFVTAIYGQIANATNTDATFAANLLMLQHTPFDRYFDWLPRFQPYGTGRPFWTIAVEWWLYVLFGIAFFASRTSVRERMVALVLVAPAASVVLYFTAWESIAWVWISSAALGILYAIMPAPTHQRYLSIGFAALLALGALIYRFKRLDLAPTMNFYDLQLIMLTSLLFGLALLLVNWPPIASTLVSSKRLWTWLAAISYSLYLTHNTVMTIVIRVVGGPGWPAVVLTCLASVAVAILFTWGLDRHHKAVGTWLKDRLALKHVGRRPSASSA